MITRSSLPRDFSARCFICIFLIFMLAACTPQAVLKSSIATDSASTVLAAQTAPIDFSTELSPFDANPDRAVLYEFILDDLLAMGKKQLLVVEVRPNQNDAHGKLDVRLANIQRAWVYLDGTLYDCPPDFFTQSFINENINPWNHAYMAFSINEVSGDFQSVTLRIDRIPGLIGGNGQLTQLARAGDQWSIESQRVTWIQ